jgi:dTDP-4-dehydrorhamnose 3,5-epimerase-like enzyme
VRVHVDARRTALCDLFQNTPGDLNLFVVKPGQRTCWHRHQKQTDRFRVIKGEMRFKYWKDRDQVWSVDLDTIEQELTILPGFWHGYENVGTGPAYLLMYLDRKFDQSDEQRLSEEEMPWLAECAPVSKRGAAPKAGIAVVPERIAGG